MKLVTKIYKFEHLSKKSQEKAKTNIHTVCYNESSLADRKYAEEIEKIADPLAEVLGLPHPQILFQGCLEDTLVSIVLDEEEYRELQPDDVRRLANKTNQKLNDLANMMETWERGLTVHLSANVGKPQEDPYVEISSNKYTKLLEKILVNNFKKLVKELHRLCIKAGYDKVCTVKESDAYYFYANGDIVNLTKEQTIEE